MLATLGTVMLVEQVGFQIVIDLDPVLIRCSISSYVPDYRILKRGKVGLIRDSCHAGTQ